MEILEKYLFGGSIQYHEGLVEGDQCFVFSSYLRGVCQSGKVT